MTSGSPSLTSQFRHTPRGFHVHQIGGFDPAAVAKHFDLDDNLVPVSVTAIGSLADVSELDERFQAREVAGRQRASLDDLVLVFA